MAEGGIAAALANVDDRDNWKVHFADTMRGGQYVNNWRMAELHAKEAPDRVRELEAWGAVFDRTHGRPHPAAQLRRPPYPRLAHVGDRTGLEMIRTLQDHGIHQGIDVYMECTVIRLLKDGDRVAGAFGYYRERGRFVVFKAKAVVLATGGIGRAYKITSNSWEYTGDGHTLAYDAGAELHRHGVRPVPSDRHGLAAERARHPGHRRRARRGRRAARTSKGERFMFDDIPENYREPDRRRRGGRLALHARATRTPSRPPELLTRDHVARCIVREVKEGRGSPHGGVFLDIAWIKERIPNAAEHIKKKLPSMYHQFKELGDIDITKRADGGRPDDALHHGRRPRRRRHADVDACRACSPAASAPPASTAPTAWAATRCPTCSCSASGPASTRPSTPRSNRRRPGRRRPGRRGRHAGRWSRSTRPGGDEGPYQIQHDLQEMMQDLVGIVRTRGGDAAGAGRPGQALASGRAQSSVAGQPRVQPRLAHRARPAQPADGLRGDHPGGARAARRAAAATSATTIPDKDAQLRQGQRRRAARAPTAGWRSSEAPIPRDAGRAEADHRGDEVDDDAMATDLPPLRTAEKPRTLSAWRRFASGAATGRAASSRTTRPRSPRAWSCSTPSTRSRPTQANDLACRWNCKAGQVRLLLGRDQRQARGSCA